MHSLTLWMALLCAPPVEMTGDEIAIAVRELGDDEFEVRERAANRLWSAGRIAEPALREAAQSPDAEVRLRAQSILESFSFGIYPETSPEITRLVHRFRQGDFRIKHDALQAIKEAGAIATLFAAVDSEPNAELREEFDRRFLLDVEVGIRKLLLDGKQREAEEFLELAAVRDRGIRHYAAYLFLTGQLDNKAARIAANPNRGASEMMLLRQLRRIASGAPAEPAMPTGDESDIRCRSLAREIVRLERDADSASTQSAAAELRQQLASRPIDDRRGLDFLVKLASRRFVAAIETLSDARDGATLSILRQERRFDDALRRAGLVADGERSRIVIENPTRDWLLKLAPDDIHTDAHQRFAAAIEVAHVLQRVGETSLAEQVTALIADELLLASPSHKAHLVWLAQHEFAIGQEEKAVQHATAALAQTEAMTAFQSMFGADADLAEVWWDSFRRLHPNESMETTLRRVRTMLDPATRPADFEQIVHVVGEFAATFDKFGRARYYQALGGICMRHADYEQAATCFQNAAQATSDAANLLSAGDALLRLGRSAAAADAYASSFQRRPDAFFARFLEGVARADSGDKALGDELIHSASVLPLGSLEARHRLAQNLWRRGHRDAAIRHWQWAVLFQSTVDAAAIPVLRELAAASAEHAPGDAATQLDRVLEISLLQPAMAGAQLELWRDATRGQQLRCLDQMRRGDAAHARLELKPLVDLGPEGMLSMSVALAPAEQQMARLWQAETEQTVAQLDRLCECFPRDVVDRLDLARFCLWAESGLDVGERRAVEALEIDAGNSTAQRLLAEFQKRREQPNRPAEKRRGAVSSAK